MLEDFEYLSITCHGLPHQVLADEDGSFLDIAVSKFDRGDSFEYRVKMNNAMREAAGEAEGDNPLIREMDMNAILGLSFAWSVQMPGTIVSEKTNADSIEGSSAEFNSSWDDTRETFEVVSLEPKSRSIFGACNRQ